MCIIELVDYNENMLGAEAKSTATRRTRRSRKSTATAKTEENQAEA